MWDKLFIGGMLLYTIGFIAYDVLHKATEPIVYTALASEDTEVTEPREVRIVVEYNDESIEQLIRDTFPESPNTMVAVAKCENGWSHIRGYIADQQSQHVLSYGQEQSWGIFQIHSPDWHTTALKLGFTEYKTDVVQNIKMARHIYDTQGITAWTCYTKGLYKKYL